jgi:hypothetical protein
VARYHFAKFPTLDDVVKENPTIIFQIGKFQESQITEFGIYSDGFIASGKCSSEVLDAFLDDALEWAEKEIGIMPILLHRNENYYETSVIVQSKVDLVSTLAPTPASTVTEVLSKRVGVTYQRSAVAFDCEQTDVRGRRRPYRLFIERKFGVPFKENIFLCQAPLPTGGLLDLLREIERQPSS